MEIMPPVRQKSWGLAAVVNFWLGGMASGAYIVAMIVPAGSGKSLSGSFQLLLLFLIGVGFSFLALHAGKPWRIIYSLRNLRSSWMARETAAGLFFFATAGWYFLFTNSFAGWLATLAAFFFLISQSFILYQGQGISGWDVAAVPMHFTLSSFSSGTGLLLFAAPQRTVEFFRIIEMVGIILVFLNAVVWLFYIYRAPALCKQTSSSLRKGSVVALLLGGGTLLPFFLLLVLVSHSSEGDKFEGWVRIYEIIAGLCLISGALLQKYLVVMKAGFHKQLLFK